MPSSSWCSAPHLLGDAVGAQRRDVAAHVDAGLVDRVAERLAGVAADHQPTRLRHERAHVADVAADHDVDALHRDPAPRSGIALDDQQPAVGGGARRLRCVALHPDGAAHHVLGDTGARVAVDGDLGLLVHPRGVVADVALDGHLHRRVDTDRDVVRAGGVGDRRTRRTSPGACRAAFTSRSGVLRRSKSGHRVHA